MLVFGGSQGARTLNELAVDAWGASGPGRAAPERRARLRGAARRASRGPTTGCFPFIDDFGAALAAADLVVSRAGGSVWELAAAGKPAVLVPYPHATVEPPGEERRVLRRARAARASSPTTQAHEQVPAARRGAARRPDARCSAMGDAMRAAAKPDAADEIADELVALAAARR